MSVENFEIYMREQGHAEFTWKDHMLPKINNLVWATLKSFQDTQEQRHNCFEIYGFDIALD